MKYLSLQPFEIEHAHAAVLDADQPAGRLLETLQLLRILVDAVVIQLPHRAKDVVELGRVDPLAAEIVAKLLDLPSPVTGFAPELANILPVEAPCPGIAPAAVPVTAAPGVAVRGAVLSLLTALSLLSLRRFPDWKENAR